MYRLEIRRPAMLNRLDQGIDVPGNALHEHADGSVGFVPDPAHHRTPGGDLGYEGPESHPLNAPQEGHSLPPPPPVRGLPHS